MKRIAVIFSLWVWTIWLSQQSTLLAHEASSFFSVLSSQDVLLVASHDGRAIYKKNETKQYSPASTLKILTALAAMHHMGRSYRFPTEFYLDRENNLKIRGYGDPLLVSEVWQEIAQTLAPKVQTCKDLILDDSYFVRDIHVPGIGDSMEPYDAPVGALCANFNTVFFERDKAGGVVSAETQTPIIPAALRHIQLLGLEGGRYTVAQTSTEATEYAGELFAHFLRERGVDLQGTVHRGVVNEKDCLIYRYLSVFSLEESLQRMLEFSNNFMANQIILALGAHEHGPPGTLKKGVQVVLHFAKEVLGLKDVRIVEGSGVSRKNQVSASDMCEILKAFEPHRRLLTRKGRLSYKTGTLKDLKTAAGYIECGQGRPYYFVLFLGDGDRDIDALIAQLAKTLEESLRANLANE